MSLQALSPVGTALLHGIWQGLALALVVSFAIRWVESAKYRYMLLWGAMLAAFILPVAYYLASPAKIVAVSSTAGPVQAGPSIDWLSIGVVIWVAGAAIGAGKLLVEWTRVRKVSAECEPASPELRTVRDRLQARMGFQKYVRIRTSLDVATPATIGSAKPIVVWPAVGFENIGEAECEALMAHELAHIQRKDFAWHIVQRVFEVGMWCFPGVLWIGHMLRFERERAADELAAEALNDGRYLAIALGKLALQRSAVPALSLAAIDSDVTGRMRSLKSWSPHRMSLRMGLAILCTLSTLGLTSLISARVANAGKVQTVYLQQAQGVRFVIQAGDVKSGNVMKRAEREMLVPGTPVVWVNGAPAPSKSMMIINLRRDSSSNEFQAVASMSYSSSSSSSYSSSQGSTESSGGAVEIVNGTVQSY